MNGQGFGAFAEGLKGGMQLGKMYKDYSTQADQQKQEAIAQASGGTVPEPAVSDSGAKKDDGDFVSDSWGTLKGIVGDLPGLKSTPAGGIIAKGMDNSIAGKLLGGGIGNTIIGKLGGGKLLSGGLLGGLFK